MHLLDLLVPRVGLFEAVELVLTAAALIAAVALHRSKCRSLPNLDRVFGVLERALAKLAGRPVLAMAALAVAAIGLRLALAPWLGTPDPVVADEFSLIFQAETMRHGHLANPGDVTPNFEAVYVLLRPSYASIYPVLRSFPLLLGLLTGVGAWGGVLLSVAALAIAVYWMVRQWVNDQTALLAAAIVIVRFGLFSLWANSYFGSAFTALGGVLLLGGYRAVTVRQALTGGIAVGLGVMILLTTRPYEALFYSAPFLIALLGRFVFASGAMRKALVAPALAAAAFIGLGLGCTVASNSAITHEFKTFPYNLYRQTSSLAPAWLINRPVPIVGPGPRYDITRRFMAFEYEKFQAYRHSLIATETARFRNYWLFYVGFALTIPFAFGLCALRRHKVALASAGTLALALSIETWTFAHYAAPGFGFFMLAIAQGFAVMRQRGGGWIWLSRLLVVALLLGCIVPLKLTFTGQDDFAPWVNNGFNTPCCWLRPRSVPNEVKRVVEQTPGRNLVLVDSGPRAPYAILIANDPVLADAQTLLVNADPLYDKATIARFPARHVWTLTWQANDGAACLTPQGFSANRAAPPGWGQGAAPFCPGGVAWSRSAFRGLKTLRD